MSKGLEEQAGREFYGKVFAVFQERWLAERAGQYRAQRWRTINQVTPFGLLRLPVRAVRRRNDGHYLTLSRLLGPKATRLLSPLIEKQALDLSTRGLAIFGRAASLAADASLCKSRPAGDFREYRRIMAEVWKADSEALLEAVTEVRLSSPRPTPPM
jgi:hypothetical protein